MYLISDLNPCLLKEELVNLLRWNDLRLGLAIACLANLARTDRCTLTWLGSGPDDIVQFLELDRPGSHSE
jgi:hypothetical protein